MVIYLKESSLPLFFLTGTKVINQYVIINNLAIACFFTLTKG